MPTLLVMAAGMGNRYGGLKQIDPIGPGGETFIGYSIYDAVRAGFETAVFVIRREIEAEFKQAVGRRFEGRIAVKYVFQDVADVPPGHAPPSGRTKPWGTGHAVLAAAEAIREPFAVINGDDFYGATSFQALADHLRASQDYAMVGFTLRNTLSENGSVSRGVCSLTEDGFLRTVTERTAIVRDDGGASAAEPDGARLPLTGDEVVSMNMWGFTPSLFDHLRRHFSAFLSERGRDAKAELFLPAVVDTLIERGQARVKVLHTPDSCFGVTYKEDRTAAMAAIGRLVARGDYPERPLA